MEKKLSEMTLEELWKLFPIVLTEHRACWSEWYAEEEAFLKNKLPQIERISHIGSTAIGSIRTKPIVDLLVEVSKNHRLADYKDLIVKAAISVCPIYRKGVCRKSISPAFAAWGRQ